MPTISSDLKAVVDALRDRDRFLVVSHENPDGDALGSLLATQLGLVAMGKDTLMVVPGEAPLPGEYRFLELPGRGLLRSRPADAAERTLVAVDCAQESRIHDRELAADAPYVVNIDHHHDNTRFGDVNLVVPSASSTAEVLADVFADLRVTLDAELAEALYVGLVTDTGRFQYSNTTPRALRLAADLVEAGASVKRVFENVYENAPFPKLKLLGKALDRARRYEDDRVVVSYLLRADFGEAEAAEPYSEGVIDYLRAIDGVELAVLLREPPVDGAARKGSLRSSVETLDVSAIARTFGGGGHRQAAGFSSELPIDEITATVVAAYAAQRNGGAAPADA
jgi:bifunctional oligoribonuclease and PAP phosphatase NrnA